MGRTSTALSIISKVEVLPQPARALSIRFEEVDEAKSRIWRCSSVGVGLGAEGPRRVIMPARVIDGTPLLQSHYVRQSIRPLCHRSTGPCELDRSQIIECNSQIAIHYFGC